MSEPWGTASFRKDDRYYRSVWRVAVRQTRMRFYPLASVLLIALALGGVAALPMNPVTLSSCYALGSLGVGFLVSVVWSRTRWLSRNRRAPGFQGTNEATFDDAGIRIVSEWLLTEIGWRAPVGWRDERGMVVVTVAPGAVVYVPLETLLPAEARAKVLAAIRSPPAAGSEVVTSGFHKHLFTPRAWAVLSLMTVGLTKPAGSAALLRAVLFDPDLVDALRASVDVERLEADCEALVRSIAGEPDAVIRILAEARRVSRTTSSASPPGASAGGIWDPPRDGPAPSGEPRPITVPAIYRVLSGLPELRPLFERASSPSPRPAPALVFHDDDRTTVEFVVGALTREVGMSVPAAFRTALLVGDHGQAGVSVPPDRDPDEVLIRIRTAAAAAGFPLRVERA